MITRRDYARQCIKHDNYETLYNLVNNLKDFVHVSLDGLNNDG